jgi:hypothetical protein
LKISHRDVITYYYYIIIIIIIVIVIVIVIVIIDEGTTQITKRVTLLSQAESLEKFGKISAPRIDVLGACLGTDITNFCFTLKHQTYN